MPKDAARAAPDDITARRKAMSDPLRLRMLERLIEPKTVKDLGAALRVEPNRLYYHLRLLEEACLIAVVGERLVGRKNEKVYGVTGAETFGNELPGPDPVAQTAFFSSILEAAKADVEHVIYAAAENGTHANMHVLRTQVYATPKAVQDLASTIGELVRTASLTTPSKRARLHSLTLVVSEQALDPP